MSRTGLTRLTLRAHAAALNWPLSARLRMATALPRLARQEGPAPQAIARAVRTTALGRIPEEEREWIGRIEAHRRALNIDEAIAKPFEAGLPDKVSWASWSVSITPVWTLFLMRLLRELAPQSCLELGTGLGISAAYQGAALRLNGAGRLITLDGSPQWAAIAEDGLESLGLEHVAVAVGPIADTLADVLRDAAPLDYALVDAEHTEEATVGYFESIVGHMSPQAVMVFDDIPWSRELRRTWRRIAQDERVSAAFALGRMGVAVISRGPS